MGIDRSLFGLISMLVSVKLALHFLNMLQSLFERRLNVVVVLVQPSCWVMRSGMGEAGNFEELRGEMTRLYATYSV